MTDSQSNMLMKACNAPGHGWLRIHPAYFSVARALTVRGLAKLLRMGGKMHIQATPEGRAKVEA